MYPCEHGDLYYKSYGMAYCRCHQGYEGVHCEHRIMKSQDSDANEPHWWSNFFDSLRRMIWGPPAQAPAPPPPQNTVNIVVRPPVMAPWDNGIGSSTSTPLLTTTSMSTESAHLNEASANDITFLISFMVIIFIIFCISCAGVAFCCWRIRIRKRNRRVKKNDQNGNGPSVSASSVTRPVIVESARSDDGHGSENESQPPSYEQAIGGSFEKNCP